MDMFPRRILPVPLPFLGVLSISGRDALDFLQGQITNDVRLLADGRTQLAALNTPQGRVVALLRLRLVDETVYALIPSELLEPVQAILRRFVLRSKVQLQISNELRLTWIDTSVESTDGGRLPGEPAFPPAPAPAPDGSTVLVAAFDYGEGRRVVATTADWPGVTVDGTPPDASPSVLQRWFALDIADGLPQVFAATSGAFVPQMLNLDLLDAISFSKGCYTGQEIVARTQHLGRIKRRLQGYRLPPGAAPAPLSALHRDGTKSAEVLMSARLDDGVRLLAVTNLDAQGSPLVTEDGRTAEPVPFPYAVASGGLD